MVLWSAALNVEPRRATRLLFPDAVGDGFASDEAGKAGLGFCIGNAHFVGCGEKVPLEVALKSGDQNLQVQTGLIAEFGQIGHQLGVGPLR